MSINRWLVPEGLAINFEPFARGRFQSDEDDARQNRRGWWRGCIAAAQHLRYWRKLVAPLLGSTCANEPNARDKLFPENPEMPPGCSIKGRFAVRAKVPGYRGIYQRRLSQLPHAEEPEPLVLFRGGRPSCRVPKSVHLQRTTRRLSRSTRQMERRPRRQSAGISVEMSSAVPAADTRGPATAARFHMPLPLPLAGERGAGGGMCPLSAIDIIDVFGISASYPQMHPRPRAASTTPRGRRMQAFAAIFANAGVRRAHAATGPAPQRPN